jgi:hypothetical protein
MKYGVAPKFTCVLSMRASMSGRILVIKDPSEIPYCIWHSENPFQTILRELKKHYPKMMYHAARACAVAGYSDLYSELQAF